MKYKDYYKILGVDKKAGKDEIKKLFGHITVPDDHPFEKIWMVADMEAKTGIVRLYP